MTPQRANDPAAIAIGLLLVGGGALLLNLLFGVWIAFSIIAVLAGAQPGEPRYRVGELCASNMNSESGGASSGKSGTTGKTERRHGALRPVSAIRRMPHHNAERHSSSAMAMMP